MRTVPSSLLCLLAVAFLGGCLYRTEKEAPVVYQGWHARYHYDLDKRRLTSSFGNKRMGRAWGRNEMGSIDYDRWWGGGGLDFPPAHFADQRWSLPFVSENLLLARRKEQDLELEKRWREDQQAMIEARRKAIEDEVGIKPKASDDGDIGEGVETAEPQPFEPEPAVPEIPGPEETNPPVPALSLPGGSPSPSPFPGGVAPDGGLPPLPGAVDKPGAPSPFPPLPGGMQTEPAPSNGGLPPLPGGDDAAAPPAPFPPLPNP